MTKELALKKARAIVLEWSRGAHLTPTSSSKWRDLEFDIAQAFEVYEQKLAVAREALEEIACKGLDQRPRARIALERLK